MTNVCGKQFRERKDLLWLVVSVAEVHGCWLYGFYTLMRLSLITEGYRVEQICESADSKRQSGKQ